MIGIMEIENTKNSMELENSKYLLGIVSTKNKIQHGLSKKTLQPSL